MARVLWPAPDISEAIHFLGDIHFDDILEARSRKTLYDLQRSRMGTPLAHVQVGDLTNDGRPQEDSLGRGFLNALPAPWYTIIGNHDLSQRSMAEWEAVYGSRNYTVDVSNSYGDFRIVAVSPDALVSDEDHVTIQLSEPTLDWLDTTLAAANRDCIIAGHAPLRNTVVGSTTGPDAVWSSAEAGFYLHPDTEIRAILNDRPRAKMIVSGHTHSPLEAPDLCKVESVGSRNVVALNSSALYYTGRTSNPTSDPLRSFYVIPTGTHFEIWPRDHGAGIWPTWPDTDEHVKTIAVPA